MAISPLNSGSIKMAGLASGLDTEELVKQMSSGAKIRLNAQKQKLQLLQWKQTAYRKTITSITDFKSKYFNLLKPQTNLSSPALFGARAVTTSNNLLKVTAAANAQQGTFNISEILQKATSAEISSDTRAIDGIKLDVSGTEGEQYKVNVNLDGLTKEITFAAGADQEATKQNLLDAVNTAFSSTKAVFSFDGNNLTVKNSQMSNLNHIFSISKAGDDLNGLNALGLSDSISSKMNLTTKIEDAAFGTELKGNGFSFSINGVDFSFSRSETFNTVVDTINNSNAGVKISYDSISGKFSIKATESGAGSSLKITQKSGNLLSAMFGEDKIGEASSISSKSIMSNGIEGVTPADGEGFAFNSKTSSIADIVNQSIKVTVNGVEKEIGLWSYDSSGTKNDFSKSASVVSQLNNELTKEFGSSAPRLSYDDKSKKFTLTASSSNDIISVGEAGTSSGSGKLLAALGFNSTNSTNEVSLDSKLFEGVDTPISATISFGDGKTLVIDNNTTIRDLIDGSYGNITIDNKGFFTLKGVDLSGTDSAGEAYLESLFGDSYNYPGVPVTSITPSFEATGENAIMTIDGNTITSNSNSFTLNGTTFDISALSTGATDLTVTVTNDTSNTLTAIKSFVEDYNKLIDELYKEISTKYDTDYAPLTDEQREEMSEKEIEQWEETAKTGLLYQDSTINRFLSDIRSAISSSSSGISLFNIGIKTSSNYRDYGKLEIDEAALTKALNEKPEQVTSLFTDVNKGLAANVTKALDRAVSTTGANKGSLVMLAGVENTSTVTENRISKQLESYKKLVETLQEKYENEQERYWNQFTNLEKMMSAYNSQSEWLTSQFS